jgi:hypothetical protein
VYVQCSARYFKKGKGNKFRRKEYNADRDREMGGVGQIVHKPIVSIAIPDNMREMKLQS